MEKADVNAPATGAKTDRVTFTRETIDRMNTLLHNLPPLEKPAVDRYSMAEVVKETRKGIEEALKAGYTYQQIADYLLREGNIAIKSASLKSVYSRVKRSATTKRPAKRKAATAAAIADASKPAASMQSRGDAVMPGSKAQVSARETLPAATPGRIPVEPDDRDL